MTSTRLFLILLAGVVLIYAAMAAVALRVYQAERTPAVVTQAPPPSHGVKCTSGEEWPRCYTTTNGKPDHAH